MSDERVKVSWRLPSGIAEEHQGDWSRFRDILDKWAGEPNPKISHVDQGEESVSVCFILDASTLKKLEKEAKRISKKTRRKWTAARVARKVFEQRGNNEDDSGV